MDAKALIKAWTYQSAVNNFGHYDLFHLKPPVDLQKLLGKARPLDVFEKNKQMLKDLFGIKYSDEQICTMPVFLKQLPPYPNGMIELFTKIHEIISETNSDELTAKKMLTILAEYYTNFFEYYCTTSAKGNMLEVISNIYRAFLWEDIRKNMYITEEIAKGLKELISSEKLYSIFERC